MDHSIRGYLSRRSTKELEAILQYCLKDENYKKYENVIQEILWVLEQRCEPTKFLHYVRLVAIKS